MSSSDPLRLAVALDGVGAHPAARHDHAVHHPARYWVGLARTAERGLLDLATLDDTGAGPDPLRIAALAASLTHRIRLVPTVPATRDAPFRVASALAALDDDSGGRAGWRVPAAVPGARPGLPVGPAARARTAAGRDDVADTVEAVGRLWDAWDHGRPRPLVVTSGRGWEDFGLAARIADVVLTTPRDAFGAAAVVDHVRAAERAAGRTGPPLRILADVVVVLADTERAAVDRLDRLDAVAPLCTDAAVLATTPSVLADRLLEWRAAGLDGYRLRPAELPADLDRIVDGLVPELRRRGAFHPAPGERAPALTAAVTS